MPELAKQTSGQIRNMGYSYLFIYLLLNGLNSILLYAKLLEGSANGSWQDHPHQEENSLYN